MESNPLLSIRRQQLLVAPGGSSSECANKVSVGEVLRIEEDGQRRFGVLEPFLGEGLLQVFEQQGLP